ncbi:MAG: hypothetical protein ACJATI_005362 [Halioglobus sp.]|jgi:hypothetical protein
MKQKTLEIYPVKKKGVMSLETEKIRLVDAIIKVKDITLLHQVRDVLNKGKTNKYTLNADQIEELELRRSNHKKGISKSYSWEEAKELIIK